jgi:hypothetical protein
MVFLLSLLLTTFCFAGRLMVNLTCANYFWRQLGHRTGFVKSCSNGNCDVRTCKPAERNNEQLSLLDLTLWWLVQIWRTKLWPCIVRACRSDIIVWKDRQSKKNHLRQFGIIHLLNPNLTYIRNSERNKIMFVLFQLLKTYIRNHSLLFISFFTLPPTGKHRWQVDNHDPRAHICVWGGEFCPILFLLSWFAKLCCSYHEQNSCPCFAVWTHSTAIVLRSSNHMVGFCSPRFSPVCPLPKFLFIGSVNCRSAVGVSNNLA